MNWKVGGATRRKSSSSLLNTHFLSDIINFTKIDEKLQNWGRLGQWRRRRCRARWRSRLTVRAKKVAVAIASGQKLLRLWQLLGRWKLGTEQRVWNCRKWRPRYEWWALVHNTVRVVQQSRHWRRRWCWGEVHTPKSEEELWKKKNVLNSSKI